MGGNAVGRVHYPRTPHLPWSPGATADDLRVGGLAGLVGRDVVVTEKLDGENTTLYSDGLHARSLDSAHHPSRAWVKALQGRIGAAVPAGWRICGENMFARHSLGYDDLAGYFYGFSIWAGDRCLDWDRTTTLLRGLGVPAVPVLWRGRFDERALRALRLDPARQEGYVVRSVDGFDYREFGNRVAKWVRAGHVQTDEHWMQAAIVPNGLGPAAALWTVRSGGEASAAELLAALGYPRGAGVGRSGYLGGVNAAAGVDEAAAAGDEGQVGCGNGSRGGSGNGSGRDEGGRGEVSAAGQSALVAEMAVRMSVLGRTGDSRLTGVLTGLLVGERRTALVPQLAGPLGLPQARRIADLVGLQRSLQQPYPDEDRRAGLVRLSFAADLGILHSLAATVLSDAVIGAGAGGMADSGTADRAELAAAREQVDWSLLHAEDAGLLAEAPLEPLRRGLRDALADLDPPAGDRCWAEAREAVARGRVGTVDEAVAATWRWRRADQPQLLQLVGPSGSGKSVLAAQLLAEGRTDAIIALDDLREARGTRADQRANDAVLSEGLGRLDAELAAGRRVVWDATSLSPHQRALVGGIARKRDALTTHVVLHTAEAELIRRNGSRQHPVPLEVLRGQVRRYAPPYPGQAHRTWYVGETGTVEDVDGELGAADEAQWSGAG